MLRMRVSFECFFELTLALLLVSSLCTFAVMFLKKLAICTDFRFIFLPWLSISATIVGFYYCFYNADELFSVLNLRLVFLLSVYSISSSPMYKFSLMYYFNRLVVITDRYLNGLSPIS